jgi:hypothetical protein
MSGGFFDYDQLAFSSMAEEIQKIIDEEDVNFVYSEDTLQELKNTVKYLKLAGIYAYRADCLLSDDDGENTFHDLLKKDLMETKL